MNIPEKGRAAEDILNDLQVYKEKDLDWQSGKITSYVYYPGDSAMDLINRAYTMYLTESALDPTSTPSILRIENEIIGMISNLVAGDENTVGNFTSGGTESVMMAVLSARNRARELKPEIKEPEIVIPYTAHACFHLCVAADCQSYAVIESTHNSFVLLSKYANSKRRIMVFAIHRDKKSSNPTSISVGCIELSSEMSLWTSQQCFAG